MVDKTKRKKYKSRQTKKKRDKRDILIKDIDDLQEYLKYNNKYYKIYKKEFMKSDNICKTNKKIHINFLKQFTLGWEHHTDIYNNDNECTYYIKVLGSFRAFIIDYLFWLYFKKFNKDIKENNKLKRNMYVAPGSTNITSDYDVIFTGPDSVNISEFIRNTFIQMYTNIINKYNTSKEQLIHTKKPLTLAGYFDTNIYVLPTLNTHIPFVKSYLKLKTNDNYLLTLINQNKTYEDIHTLQCYTPMQAIISIDFLFKKAILNDVDDYRYVRDIFEGFYNLHIARATKTKTIKTSTTLRKKDSIFIPENFNKKILSYENQVFMNCNKNTNFELCYNSYFTECKRLQDKFLNNNFKDVLEGFNNNSEDLFNQLYYHICHASMYSIDAYYTPSSMIVVVYEDQMNMKTKGNKTIHEYNYYITLIENIIDFVIHAKLLHDRTYINDDIRFMKYSKYFKRIFSCLKHLNNNNTDSILCYDEIMKLVQFRNKETKNTTLHDIMSNIKEKLNMKNATNIEICETILKSINSNSKIKSISEKLFPAK